MTDEQKLILHLCLEAEKRGRDEAWITRGSMLDGKTVPQAVGVRLVWAALTMRRGVLEWTGDEQAFRLSDWALTTISATRDRRLAGKESR